MDWAARDSTSRAAVNRRTPHGDLKYWNGLRRNIIRVDQKLVIYVSKSRADRYKGMAKVAK